jgi:hypothetical protein
MLGMFQLNLPNIQFIYF